MVALCEQGWRGGGGGGQRFVLVLVENLGIPYGVAFLERIICFAQLSSVDESRIQHTN